MLCKFYLSILFLFSDGRKGGFYLISFLLISPLTEEREEEKDELSEALEEIASSPDWTMDILNASPVLTDFYKLARPPPLPELAEGAE